MVSSARRTATMMEAMLMRPTLIDEAGRDLHEDHEEGEDLGVSLEGLIGDFGLLHVQILQTVI
jgi:hypothetical protein